MKTSKNCFLVLEHEFEVFDRTGRPDYEILQTIIQYFQDYPESCHHPKEEMIFEKLKARDPTAAKRFGNVEADHGVEAKRLRSLPSSMLNGDERHDILRY
jgi:hemerythrin-like domain-containing protein